MSTVVKIRLDAERCERQARLALAIGGVAAIAVDIVDPDARRIGQLVRVRPPAAPEEHAGKFPGVAEVDIDYLVSPPELTAFLADALQNPGSHQRPLEEATRGQMSGPACQIAQELLGVSHLLACRIESGPEVLGLLVFAMQRPITTAERPIIQDFAARIADALPAGAVRPDQSSEGQRLLQGILAVADAARLAGSDHLDALLGSITDRLRATLDADSVFLALPDGIAQWRVAVSLSEAAGHLHAHWASGPSGEASGGIAGWVYQPEHYQYYCFCHGRMFDRIGRQVAIKVDCPPLEGYAIEFLDGQVIVDTDHSIPRSDEEADRVVPLPAAAFVSRNPATRNSEPRGGSRGR